MKLTIFCPLLDSLSAKRIHKTHKFYSKRKYIVSIFLSSKQLENKSEYE